MERLVAAAALTLLLAAGARRHRACRTCGEAESPPRARTSWTARRGTSEGGGSTAVPGHLTYRRNSSGFVLRFEGQDGRTFWGEVSSARHAERLIGVLSADGRRFVMVDEDGEFDGVVVDADTLDDCYRHITPTNRAVACGLLRRQR